MNWKDVGKQIAGVGLPLLGGAVGGPGGAVVGRLIASGLGLSGDADPEKVATAISTNPDNVVKLREIELKHQEVIAQAAYEADKAERDADSADLAKVNETMQKEAASEHWLQWSWRPLNGYSLAIGSLALVLGVLYMAFQAIATKDMTSLNAIPSVVTAVATALAIPGAVCGVTAWHRGIAQRIDAGEVRKVAKAS